MFNLNKFVMRLAVGASLVGFGGETGFAAFPNQSYSSNLLNGPTHSGYIKAGSGTGYQNQPHAHDGFVVVSGNGTQMFVDISDPFSPDVLQVVTSPYRVGNNREQEGHTLSFAKYPDGTEYMVTIGGRGIDIWDVTNIGGGVSHVISQDLPKINYGDVDNAIWGLAWQGDTIYVGATNNGIYIIDATNPRNLTDVVSPSSPKDFEAIPIRNWNNIKVGPVFPIGNILTFGTPKNHSGVVTLDISQRGNPITLDTTSCSSTSYIVWFYGRWMVCEQGVAIYDVTSNPRNINHIGTFGGPASEYLSFGDDKLYLGALRSNGGVYKYDISDISNPRLMGKIINPNTGADQDDQFSVPIGNLIYIADDQIDRGSYVAVHDTARDTMAPRLLYANPVDNSIDVPVSSRFGLSFSDQIDLNSVDPSSLILRPLGSTRPVPGYYGLNHTLVHFAPMEPLRSGTDYELILPRGGIKDLVGNGLEEQYVIHFRTDGLADDTDDQGSDDDDDQGSDGDDDLGNDDDDGDPGNDDDGSATQVLEAEDGELSDSAQRLSANEGFIGAGYVDYPTSGGLLGFELQNMVAGNYELTVRYANGASVSRELQVHLNGVNRGLLSFPSTGAWTSWSTASIGIPIRAGTNSLQLVGTPNPGPNVDQVRFNRRGELEPECTIQTSSPTEVGDVALFTSGAPGQLRYRWSFGDGSSDELGASVRHTYRAPGRYGVALTVENGASTTQCAVTHIVYNPLTTGAPRSSSSVAYDVDRQRIWNVNPDNDTVTAIDSESLSEILEVRVDDDPRSVAVANDGSVWVSHFDSSTITVLNGNGFLLQRLSLPYASQPYGLVISPDGQRAYVGLQALGRVLAIDVSSRSIVDALELGSDLQPGLNPKARAMAVTADGTRLLVGRFISDDSHAEVYEIDTQSFRLQRTFELEIDKGSGEPTPDDSLNSRGLLNYLNGISISPDGSRAWIAAKKDNIERGVALDGRTPTFDSTVRTVIAPIDLSSGQELVAQRVDIDNADMAFASVFSPLGDLLFVALQGSNQVKAVNAYTGEILTTINVAKAPQGLVLDASGRLFVHNFLSRSISVIDVAELLQGTSVDVVSIAEIGTVSREVLSPQVLFGKQIFYDASNRAMSKDGYLSCASCHLDGGEDGRVFDFSNRGEGLRNSISLRGRAGTGHGPVHWTGNFDEIQDFENDMRAHFGGLGFMPEEVFNEGTLSQPLGEPKAGTTVELDALAAYVASLDAVPASPYRETDGLLTAQAQAGEDIFRQLDCVRCHSGPEFTDSALNRMHDVGTITERSGQRSGGALTGLDTPTLKGIWNTAPYLHDGSATDLYEVINNPLHGEASSLSAVDKDQLVAYLLQIDENSENLLPEGDSSMTFELESFATQNLFSPLEVETDLAAEGNQYIVWPDDNDQIVRNVESAESGQVQIFFVLSQLADVEFIVRANMSNGSNDSFYYRLDSRLWLTQNDISTNGWDRLIPTTFTNVSAGPHMLYIKRREDGTQLDNVTLNVSAGIISEE